MMPYKALILIVCLFLSGCATNDYAKRLSDSELLFEKSPSPSQDFSMGSLEDIGLTVGADRTGYIAPDRSPERIQFERQFPIVSASESDYKELSKFSHIIRAGQVVLLSADLDPRTAGYVKDSNGNSISISGIVDIGAAAQLAQTTLMGGSVGAAMGMNSVAAANSELAKSGLQLGSSAANNAVMSGVATGLLGGLIAGLIINHQVQEAIHGIAKTKMFGPRMQESTNRPEAPRAIPIGPDGVWLSAQPVVIAPGVVKRVLIHQAPEQGRDIQRVVFLSVVANYRGEQYESAYPRTGGWEYRITNINSMLMPKKSPGGEAYFKELKNSVVASGIRL